MSLRSCTMGLPPHPPPPVAIDRHSPEGRRAIARFHSDAESTMKGGVPRWFRRSERIL
jgi:hypothetical protein